MDIISIGVDPGLTNIGVGIVDTQGEYVDSFVIRTETKNGIWDQGAKLAWQLEKIFNQWHFDYDNSIQMAVESPSFGSAFNAQNVAFSRGIVCVFAAQHSISVIDAPPASVKKLVAGNGKATKQELRQAVCGYTNLPTLADRSLDETDAIATALWLYLTTVNPGLKPKRKAAKQTQESLGIVNNFI